MVHDNSSFFIKCESFILFMFFEINGIELHIYKVINAICKPRKKKNVLHDIDCVHDNCRFRFELWAQT